MGKRAERGDRDARRPPAAGTLVRAQTAAFLAACAIALAVAAPVGALTTGDEPRPDDAAVLLAAPGADPAPGPPAIVPDAAPAPAPAPADESVASPLAAEAPASPAPAVSGDAQLAAQAAAAPAAVPPPPALPPPPAASPPAAPPIEAQAAPPTTPEATAAPGPAQTGPLPAGCAVDLILGTAPIVGTNGDDTLTGTAGNDFICGLGGNDTIDGLAGDDRIDGGAGDDIVRGGDGRDVLGGGAGDDAIHGDAGNDCLGGGPGDDVLVGGPGADRLDGGSGRNVLRGADAGAPGTTASDVRFPDAVRPDTFAGGCRLPPFTGPGDLGNFLDDLVGEAKTLADRVTGLGTDDAQASGPRPLAVRPFERPQPIIDGTVRVEVLCRGEFTTSEGTVQLKTFPKRAEPRDLGDPVRFDCAPDTSRPEVRIELPEAEERLVEQLGRLRVEAVADARTPDGQTQRALSHFTLVPERP